MAVISVSRGNAAKRGLPRHASSVEKQEGVRERERDAPREVHTNRRAGETTLGDGKLQCQLACTVN